MKMMNHVVNLLTKDYNCGAFGFMMRNGKVSESFSGFIIAGDLKNLLT
ncbi:metallopeptidase TldD-related protein [Aristophania vespae]